MSAPPLSPVERYFIESLRTSGRRSWGAVILRGAILIGSTFTLGVALAIAAFHDTRPDFVAAAAIGIPAGVLFSLAGQWVIRRVLHMHDAHSGTSSSDKSNPL